MDCLVYYTTVFSVVTQRPKNSCVADYELVDGTFFEPCVHEVHVQPSSTFYVLRNDYCNKTVHFMGILYTWHFLVQMYL